MTIVLQCSLFKSAAVSTVKPIFPGFLIGVPSFSSAAIVSTRMYAIAAMSASTACGVLFSALYWPNMMHTSAAEHPRYVNVAGVIFGCICPSLI